MGMSMNLGHIAFKCLVPVPSMLPTNTLEADDMSIAMYPPMGERSWSDMPFGWPGFGEDDDTL
jgi:hypothetical protein